MAKIAETPLMKQYAEMKKKHPDAILLFRVGDFYETFADDAVDASRILGITLTRRGNGSASSTELAGFPHHALDTYLPKLVRAGRRVAICEQLEDPKLTKKLVKRGITELITPGVNPSDRTLPAAENNFLAAVHFMPASRRRAASVGVAFLDITTGEFLCACGSSQEVGRLIGKLAPKEIIRMRGSRQAYDQAISHRCAVNELEDWAFTPEAARERLLSHFHTASLKGFGIDSEQTVAATVAAGAVLHYLDYTGHCRLSNIASLSFFNTGEFMTVDPFTARNLELVVSAGGASVAETLDRTITSMGARMLRQWLLFPLLDVERIRRRQDATEFFFRDPRFREDVRESLKGIGDLYRLLSRMSGRKINPPELRTLGSSLWHAMKLREALLAADNDVMRSLGEGIRDCSEAIEDILHTVSANPPALLSKGGAIARGVSEELDSLRDVASGGRSGLQQILEREIEATGITSLKIDCNNVFGYYIEVRNTHREKVPESWIRKQTLVSAERYITPELKRYEETITGAEEKILMLEARLFEELLCRLDRVAPRIAAVADTAARIDCLQSAAAVAEDYGYVRPVVDDSLELSITEGRHPVIERSLPAGEPYISNSVALDCDHRQILMLTGPNMSGKSAFLRQTALIVLMAQTGMFIPAEAAKIGIVDRIFTRVGASDNISAGESTFMVEMTEAAAILNNMTARSLILFDELGRGTSTYDGISIAWAIVEHIHENGRFAPKTLFATHYHELNEMEKSFGRIVNYNVSVREIDGKVVFVRKLERGGSAHSFGIHVARLAGMPPSIVKRADQVLSQLEAASGAPASSEKEGGKSPAVSKTDVSGVGSSRDGYQLSLFQLDDPMLSQIRDRIIGLDVNNLTPLQALTALSDLQQLLKG